MFDVNEKEFITEKDLRYIFSSALFAARTMVKVATRLAKQEALFVKTLFDFAGKSDAELKVKKGETMTLIQKRDDGWSWCEKTDGTKGYIPSNFVSLTSKPVETSSPRNLTGTSKKTVADLVEILVELTMEELDQDLDKKISKQEFLRWGPYSYALVRVLKEISSFDFGVPIQKQEGIKIEKLSPEWKELFKLAGVKESELKDSETAEYLIHVITRAFPNSQETLTLSLSKSQPDLTASDDKDLICVLDFNALSKTEISIKKGDIFKEIEERQNGWILIKTPEGKQGHVPKSYCQPLSKVNQSRSNRPSDLISNKPRSLTLVPKTNQIERNKPMKKNLINQNQQNSSVHATVVPKKRTAPTRSISADELPVMKPNQNTTFNLQLSDPPMSDHVKALTEQDLITSLPPPPPPLSKPKFIDLPNPKHLNQLDDQQKEDLTSLMAKAIQGRRQFIKRSTLLEEEHEEWSQ